MATLAKHGFFGLFRHKEADRRESTRARRFARQIYKDMGGPTEQMKRFYKDLLDNERRSRGE